MSRIYFSVMKMKELIVKSDFTYPVEIDTRPLDSNISIVFFCVLSTILH